MLKLSKKLLFAIEAVLDIAYNSGSQPVQSREITARQGIPAPLPRTSAATACPRRRSRRRARTARAAICWRANAADITVGEITRVVAALDPAEPLTEEESASELGKQSGASDVGATSRRR